MLRRIKQLGRILAPKTTIGHAGAGVKIDRRATIDGYRDRIRIADHTKVDAYARIVTRSNLARVDIGSKCKIRHHSVLDAKAGSIQLGESCTVGTFTILLGAGGLIIGDNVSIGPHCVIVASNHIFADPNTLIQQQGNSALGITIGSDIWIGAGARILDGITIGDGSVIAAGAVVSSTVPPFTVVGGVPARKIGSRG